MDYLWDNLYTEYLWDIRVITGITENTVSTTGIDIGKTVQLECVRGSRVTAGITLRRVEVVDYRGIISRMNISER